MADKNWIRELCPEIADWQADLIIQEWHNQLLEEREACAKLCIQMGTEPMEWQPSKLGIRPEHLAVAEAIRARSGK